MKDSIIIIRISLYVINTYILLQNCNDSYGEDRKTERIITPTYNMEKRPQLADLTRLFMLHEDSPNSSNPFLPGVRLYSYKITLTTLMAFAFIYLCLVRVYNTLLCQWLILSVDFSP